MLQVIRANLLLDKACYSKLNYPSSVCDDLNADSAALDAVQTVVSDYDRTLALMAFAPRIFYALVAGAWSDRNGRKAVIALPIAGQVKNT